LQEADATTMGRLGHRLKGSAAYVGAEIIGDVAASIEREAPAGHMDLLQAYYQDLRRSIEDFLLEVKK
jgi:HPt (histidine-containing phosphotransfer) domain-containing protein